MQFVAASKLRRAQESTLAARPYREKLDEVLADLAAVLGGDEHPLLAAARGRQAADRPDHDATAAGRAAQHQHRSASPPARSWTTRGDLEARDRRAARAATRCAAPASRSTPTSRASATGPRFADVLPLARLITDDYVAGTYDRVDIVYSRFVSTLVQRPDVDQLLPIEPTTDTRGIPGNQFIFEPSPASVLRAAAAALRRRRASTRPCSRAKASEESSQMVAMKNATENAEELIDDLTLTYNKVRQANITREMIEIATGAQAR